MIRFWLLSVLPEQMHLDKHYSIAQVGQHVIVVGILGHVPAPVMSVSMLRWGLAIYWQESLIHGEHSPLVGWTDGRSAKGDGRSEKPNPKTRSYICLSSYHDTTWPCYIFSFQIRSQGCRGARVQLKQGGQTDQHMQTHMHWWCTVLIWGQPYHVSLPTMKTLVFWERLHLASDREIGSCLENHVTH